MLLPDTGVRYLSKVHSDEWMKENRLLDGFDPTIAEVLDRRPEGIPRLVAVDSSSALREAIALIRQYDVSQMPVLQSGRNVGVVNEARILRQALEDGASLARPVTELMDPRAEISLTERRIAPSFSGGATRRRAGARWRPAVAF